MNKKAALFHWIIFGMLLALAIFFSVSKVGIAKPEVKGEWQISFLESNYLEAEKQLLVLESIARNTGAEAALEMAENGGFLEEAQDGCGIFKTKFFIWNKAEKWCFPEIKNNLNGLATQKFSVKLPETKFLDFGYDKTYLWGKGEMKEIKTKSGTYRFDNSFSFNLGYSFDEYEQLKSEAAVLIRQCSNDNNLKNCLTQNKPSHWEYTDCEKPDFTESQRQVPFCIESPNKALVSLKNVKKLITYHLALDFTSKKPFSPETPVIEFDAAQNLFKISFIREEADSYPVYYTDWPQAKDKKGSPTEIFQEMPVSFGYFQKSFTFENPKSENCPNDKAAGTAYLCGNEVIYLWQDNDLVAGKKYFLTLTSVKETKESMVEAFAEFSS